MICKFCSAEMEEGVTLCPVCGKENMEEVLEADPIEEAVEETPVEEVAEVTPIEEVTGEEAVEEPTEQMEEVPGEEPVEAPKKKPKKWQVVLAIIGAFILAGVLGAAVYYGISASKPIAKSYTVSDAKAEKAQHTVVATVGDLGLTNSELQVFYWQAVEEFYSYYGAYIDASVLDLSKPLDSQFYDEEAGITWQKYFLDSALSVWSRYAALNMAGVEAGFQLDAETQAYLDGMMEQMATGAAEQGFASTNEMIQASMGPACEESGYFSFLSTNIYAGQYLDSLYDTLVPTMEEIESYYAANEEVLNQQGIADDGSITVDVRHILICPKGGTEGENGEVTYSEAEWEQCRLEAQELLDKWSAEDGTEEGFAQYAMDHTEDPGSMATGGLYTDVYVGQMVEPFEAWCFDESRKQGDTGLVQTNYGYHIMYFVDSREVWIGSVQDTMINERSLALVNEAVTKWPMEAKYNKIVLTEIAE